jgi:F-type H+-transporting ATPase subunit b
MEQMVQALGGILLKAIPTAVLLLLLYAYLKAMLFRPLEKIQKQRHELTEGARQTAAQSLAKAEKKTQEFEAKLQEARSQIYKDQEEQRRKWLEDQAAQIAEARARQEKVVKDAKFALAAEAASARQTLLDTSGQLADQIAAAVLSRRVS